MLYSIEEDALQKILLHAAKYPSHHVVGILLGSLKQKEKVVITDAIPLFHNSLFLSPCVETALVQVGAHAEQQGAQLVGLYYGDYNFNATSLHPAVSRLADRLHEKSDRSCVLFIEGKVLAQFSKDGSSSPVQLLQRDETRGWRRTSVAESSSSALKLAAGSWVQAQQRFLTLYKLLMHRQLADFDEHLDDLSRDYLNAQLLQTLPGQ